MRLRKYNHRELCSGLPEIMLQTFSCNRHQSLTTNYYKAFLPTKNGLLFCVPTVKVKTQVEDVTEF